MRFKRHLTEITKSSIPRVNAIFKKRIPELHDELLKKKFKVSDSQALKILNKIFNKNHIVFKMDPVKEGPNIQDTSVAWGQTWEDGAIEIFLNKGFGHHFITWKNKEVREKYFFNADMNPFLRELYDLLTHEFIHKVQVWKSSGKAFQGEYADISGDQVKYYAQKEEIEAYAQTAAIQLQAGSSKTHADTYMALFPPDHPVRKRFFKKLYLYMSGQAGGKKKGKKVYRA